MAQCRMGRNWVGWVVGLWAAAALLAAGQEARAGKLFKGPQPQYDLFYNYYVDGAGGVPAKLYIAPRPTPPLVGHTYVTYQPLMPHEYLYRPHLRVYRRWDGRWLPANTTRAWWW